MKTWLNNFYLEHKSIFEFCGAILVVTGLFLNIPNPLSSIGSTSLHYVKFFLLFLSCFSVGYLIVLVYRELSDYILRDTDKNDFGSTVAGLQRQIDFLVGKILIVTFLLLISVLIVINLSIFIFDIYTTELTYMTIVTISYLIAYKSSKFIDRFAFLSNFTIYLYILWMFILVLVLPVGLFILMYLGLHESVLNYFIHALETRRFR